MAGLVLSVVLIVTTVTSYNDAKSSYPAKLATYRANLAHYRDLLARYTAAHGRGLPKPTSPTAPSTPELTAFAFALPLLYLVLSVAYLYLGYRVAQKRRAQQA